MHCWRLSTLIVVLALLLAACGSSGASRSAAAQSVRPPAVVPGSNPTTTAIVSGTVLPTDSVAVPNYPPDTCPVTPPPDPPFTPPPPYPPNAPYKDEFWYGTEDLWTMLRDDGRWWALPHHDTGYTQKVFWWRQGYNWRAEPQPELTVAGRRLDAEAPPLVASRATNAYHPDFNSAMLVGVDVPTPGCWEITGYYEGHELSFVVWVAP